MAFAALPVQQLAFVSELVLSVVASVVADSAAWAPSGRVVEIILSGLVSWLAVMVQTGCLPVVVLVLAWRVLWVRAVVVVVVREVAVVLSPPIVHGNSWTVKRPYLRSQLQ